MPSLTYSDDELGLNAGWDQNSDGTQLDPNIRREIREARIAKRELADAKAKAETAERQLAFLSAGVPNDVRGQFFARAYDGPTDAESVKAAYEALFGTSGAPAGTGSTEPAGEGDTEAARRIAEAAGGGTPAGSGTVKLEDALRAAKGDNAKIREILANAPPEAGIKLPEIV